MDFGIKIERIFREPHMVVFRGGLMLEYVAVTLWLKKILLLTQKNFRGFLWSESWRPL